MKYKYLYSTMLWMSVAFVSCESDKWKDNIPGMVATATSELTVLERYDIGESYDQELVVVKAGWKDASTKVTFEVSQELLDSLNLADGTSYQLLPASCYQLSQSEVVMDKGVQMTRSKFTYYPEKIKGFSEYNEVKFVLPFRINSQGLSSNPERNSLLYAFKVLEPAVKVKQVDMQSVSFGKNESVPDMHMDIEVLFTNNADIALTLKADEAKVAAYNQQNGAYLSAVPADAYTLDPASPVLKSGENNVAVAIRLKKDVLKPGNYLLPIELTKVSHFIVDAQATGNQFLISYLGDKISKADWTIEANTEELVAEGAVNGHATALIDDNDDTFWHAQWQGGSHPLPHILTIDMKENVEIAQIELTRRNGQSGTKYIDFEVSLDGQTWEKIGSFEVVNADGPQLYAVKQSAGRYLKMIVPEKQGGTVSYMAELSVRGNVVK